MHGLDKLKKEFNQNNQLSEIWMHKSIWLKVNPLRTNKQLIISMHQLLCIKEFDLHTVPA